MQEKCVLVTIFDNSFSLTPLPAFVKVAGVRPFDYLPYYTIC